MTTVKKKKTKWKVFHTHELNSEFKSNCYFMKEGFFSKNIYNSKSEVISYDILSKFLKITWPLSFLYVCICVCVPVCKKRTYI